MFSELNGLFAQLNDVRTLPGRIAALIAAGGMAHKLSAATFVMSSPANPLAQWADRATSLRQALVRIRREDAVVLVDAVTLALSVPMPAADPTELLSIVARILVEAKLCATEKRPPKPDIVAEAEALRATTEDATAVEATSILEGFGAMDESELDALAQAVTASAKPRDELGTLGESLNGVKGSAARVLMKGELHPGLLTDLMQLFAQNMETGCLVVDGAIGRASVYFREGRIVDTLFGSDVGEKAFFRAMSIQEGRFLYQKNATSSEVRIHRSAQHLIMDTLRIMDEAS